MNLIGKYIKETNMKEKRWCIYKILDKEKSIGTFYARSSSKIGFPKHNCHIFYPDKEYLERHNCKIKILTEQELFMELI